MAWRGFMQEARKDITLDHADPELAGEDPYGLDQHRELATEDPQNTATFTLLVYAALGDSYSAGLGADPMILKHAASPSCWHAATHAYPVLIDSTLEDNPAGSPFRFVACAGAVMANFTASQNLGGNPPKIVPPQLSALERGVGDVGLVTFTISGNDAHFVQVLTDCVRESCQAKDGGQVKKDLATIKSGLPKLFRQIKAQPGLAPDARILVVGYPLFFDPDKPEPKSCPTGAGTHFVPSDTGWIDSSIMKLDKILSDSAMAYGFTYVDDSTAFGSGHYLCEKSPDLNSVVLWPTTQLSGSFHPTAAGQHAIAGVVEKTLGIG